MTSRGATVIVCPHPWAQTCSSQLLSPVLGLRDHGTLCSGPAAAEPLLLQDANIQLHDEADDVRLRLMSPDLSDCQRSAS